MSFQKCMKDIKRIWARARRFKMITGLGHPLYRKLGWGREENKDGWRISSISNGMLGDAICLSPLHIPLQLRVISKYRLWSCHTHPCSVVLNYHSPFPCHFWKLVIPCSLQVSVHTNICSFFLLMSTEGLSGSLTLRAWASLLWLLPCHSVWSRSYEPAWASSA